MTYTAALEGLRLGDAATLLARPVRMANVVPRLLKSPGRIRHTAPNSVNTTPRSLGASCAYARKSEES
jgi:hypothetical protein